MKRIFLILAVIITGLVSAGCFKTSVSLEEEFTLSPGRGAVIREEHFEITFLEVTEDSRCPKDVTCVWEGRATSLVRLVSYDKDLKVELSEPGLTDQGNGLVFLDYLINFHLLPYPEDGVETGKGDYRLRLTISRLK
ncbi:hypothetical protein ACFLU1_07285 [Chloroflexota bacterium]